VPSRWKLVTASDEDLLALTPREPEAFGLFYDRYEPSMLSFFRRATGRADVAADLTAEVFAQALKSLPGYKPALGSAKAWLFGIARHELANTWERGRVEDSARRALEMERLVLTPQTLERIEQVVAEAVVMELLDGLPEDQRAAVAGRVLEDRSYDELAAELICSPSVVRQRVSRGLRSLRARLEEGR
jgi:RNA polymerase sigma-70 factor (ECF subfamily)